jgi:four helix bundle suffix protein
MPQQRTKGTKRTKTPETSFTSSKSFKSLSPEPDGFIPPHGGYHTLFSYQKALIVFQATQYFCNRFISEKSRTYDQMVQAARSGKQIILEASRASGTSKECELKLTNVARASPEELLEDYRDFMRSREIEEWPLSHPYAKRLRQLNRITDATYETFKRGIEHPDPAICANVIVRLINVTSYLRRLERDFLNQGGLRERMTRARLSARSRQQP